MTQRDGILAWDAGNSRQAPCSARAWPESDWSLVVARFAFGILRWLSRSYAVSLNQLLLGLFPVT